MDQVDETTTNPHPYPVFSLFSGGIAGLCCRAIHHAGIATRFQVTQFVERDSYRQRLLAQNHPGVPIWDDVRTYSPEPGQFFAVVGGSPCTDNSGANPKGRGLAGDRSGLWWEQLRIIQECRPAIMLWENPAGCRYPKQDHELSPLGMVLWSLSASGYVPQWQSIKASDVGAPHQRDRVFVIAYSNNLFERFSIVPTPWSGQIGKDIEALANPDRRFNGGSKLSGVGTGQEHSVTGVDFARPRLAPPHQGVDNGPASELNSYSLRGWWRLNPFVGEIQTKARSLPHRGDRIAALGDAVVPQQAAAAWKYIDYLTSLLEERNDHNDRRNF